MDCKAMGGTYLNMAKDENKMNLPEGWPTQRMLSAAYKIDRADYGCEIHYVQACVKAALAAAPTPPAQEDEAVAYRITAHDGLVWLNSTPTTLPRHHNEPLYTRPDYRLRKASMGDEPQTTNFDNMILADQNQTLQNDLEKLRKAAEEFLAYLDTNEPVFPHQFEVAISNLRAALERK